MKKGAEQLNVGEGAAAMLTYNAARRLAHDCAKDSSEVRLVEAGVAKATDLERMKAAGKEAFTSGELDDAVNFYSDAVHLVPDSTHVRELLEAAQKVRKLNKDGQELLKGGDFDGAADLFHEALELDPEFLFLQQEEDDAMRRARAALLRLRGEKEMDPADWRHDYNVAITTFDEALELDPGNEAIIADREIAARKAKAAALMKQAEAQADDANFAKAVILFDSSLELDPGNGECTEERELAAAKAKSLALEKDGLGMLEAGVRTMTC